MSEPNAPSEYVRLAFLIDQHLSGYVDAYYGPEEWKPTISTGAKPPIAALEDLTHSLEEAISTDPTLTPSRSAYLSEELRAMRTTIRILGGNTTDIVDEVECLFGVTPKWVDESVFAEAHAALKEVLPGPEPLRERVLDFRKRSRIPVEVAAPMIRDLVDDLRGRARLLFDLPPREECEVSFVRDKSWLAYNWYLGHRKSLIEFNQDFPMEVWRLPSILAHESYPGHHAEHAIKEHRLYREEGRLEHSILLNNTPASFISEGIAQNALEAVASEAEIVSILTGCYERTGLPKSDAARAMDFFQAYRRLDKVADNQVLLLYREHPPDEEIIAYGVRHALTDEDDESRGLRFYKDPLWRSYTYNYTLGRELIAEFLRVAGDKTTAFQRLLSEPCTPTQIRQSVTSPN